MRFDDSLTTVLSADTTTAFGAQSAWRQLVDLMARGRIANEAAVIERLRDLRESVPAPVRAASARALAFGMPGIALVGFFAEDDLPIAAPVLRTATLDGAAWQALLPDLTPAQRSVLRHRRDLPQMAVRGLESFGATDFVLPSDVPAIDDLVPSAVSDPHPMPAPAADTPRSATPFVALGDVARGLPVVAEAMRRSETVEEAPRFAISDLVARIDAFNRSREETPEPSGPRPSSGFRFETDSGGTIRWVDGAPRAALVGASIAGSTPGVVSVDGGARGAFRRRARFADVRMEIGGLSDAAGSWRIAGIPVFEQATGRFVGYRGTARRPRVDESAAPVAGRVAPDALRQLVHELRTPTNAVAGFAELIESELLGPVAPVHRARATTIRELAGNLVGAIEDLDTAARIGGRALDLRPGAIAFAPIVARVLADLRPLASLRGVDVRIDDTGADLCVFADDRATERLLARLMAAVVASGGRGEALTLAIGDDGQGMAVLTIDRPVALADPVGATVFAIDAAHEDEAGVPLLGTGFALRLARNLAHELGGSLGFEPARLALRLPLAGTARAGQVSIS